MKVAGDSDKDLRARGLGGPSLFAALFTAVRFVGAGILGGFFLATVFFFEAAFDALYFSFVTFLLDFFVRFPLEAFVTAGSVAVLFLAILFAGFFFAILNPFFAAICRPVELRRRPIDLESHCDFRQPEAILS